jgi:hypothetical protein
MERTQQAKNKTKDMPINPAEREDLDREEGMEKNKATTENRSTGYREDGDAFDNNPNARQADNRDIERLNETKTGPRTANPAQDENH